jgi:membrane associated rhomboid family serine protease
METTNLRPTFLTILCVLTFIASGYGIYNAISGYTSAEMAADVAKDAMDEAQDKIESENEEVPAFIGKLFGSISEGLTPENIRNSAIASGVGNILTLIGAVLMWGLNKKGYFLYIFGTLVLIVAPLMIFDGFVGSAASGWAAFVGVLFGVLYGVNLKHMS